MSLQRKDSEPVNKGDSGPLGFGIVPSIRQMLKNGFLKKYLTDGWKESLKMHPNMANISVAHASTNKERSSMNIAFPDLTAEYWQTVIPADKAPIIRIQFPDWARYAAVTAYNTYGLPIASINASDVKRGEERLVEGTKDVYNLMGTKTIDWNGPVTVLYRVYRPEELEICPQEDLPRYVLMNKSDRRNSEVITGFDFSEESIYLENASEDLAIENGKKTEEEFQKAIGKRIKALTSKQKGSQFFCPVNVQGMFVNMDATYVCAWLPDDKNVMRMSGIQIPEMNDSRCFYGFMSVDKKTTETNNSFIDVDFQSNATKDEEFTLYVAKNNGDAVKAGYDSIKKTDKLLLWSQDVIEPGVVVRYLHYTANKDSNECVESVKEIQNLRKLDGTKKMLQKSKVVGIGHIEYF